MFVDKFRGTENKQIIQRNTVKASEKPGEKEEKHDNDMVSLGSEKIIMPPDLRKIRRYEALENLGDELSRAGQPQSAEKEWTVLLYMDGANDLEPKIAEAMRDLERLSPDVFNRMNVVAQVARLSQDELRKVRKEKYKNSGNKELMESAEHWVTNIDNDWHGVRRYLIKPNQNQESNNYSSELKENLYLQDVSHPNNFADFMSWGMKTFPSKKVMVVVMDHGSGWPGAINNDFSGPNGSMMSTPSIGASIEKAEKSANKKVNVLHMATCLMGAAEVGTQMENKVDYLVASEEIGTSDGLKYKGILEKLDEEIKLGTDNPRNVSEMIVQHYSEPENRDAFLTKASIDVSKMPQLREGIDNFAKALIGSSIPVGDLKLLLSKAEHYGNLSPFKPFTDYRDVYEMAEIIAGSPSTQEDTKLVEAAKNLKKAMADATIKTTPPGIYKKEEKVEVVQVDEKTTETYWKETTKEIHSNGLSLYMPMEASGTYETLKKDYKQLDLANKTMWDEWLEKEVNVPIAKALEQMELPLTDLMPNKKKN